MEDFLYSYNQPKKFGKYDLFLDGKVTVNELVYKILTEDGEYQNIDIAEKVKEIESRLQTHFTFEHVDELPTEGKETVIYLVPNADTSDDPDTKDKYDEYMWDEEHQKFELIGSGSYAQQKAELDKEIADRKADVDAEEERAKAAEKVLTDNLAQEVKDREGADNALDEKIEKRVVINDPITITEGDNTTSITSDTISTTTFSGTLDAESMKNSLTAEAIQTVVPIACGEWMTTPTASGSYSVAIGSAANAAGDHAFLVGGAGYIQSCAVGMGHGANAMKYGVAFGHMAKSIKNCNVTIGSAFSDTSGEYTCQTQGTGSITIGAGTNTLNPTNADGTPVKDKDGKIVESSNSVTIGCKAENKGADSVVIGAQAKGWKMGAIVIGAEAEGSLYTSSVSIGRKAKSGNGTVSIGSYAITENGNCVIIGSGGTITNASSTPSDNATVIGNYASARAQNAVALGANAKVGDTGATVIRSTAEDGTYTQLYFSGANTPLALKYYPTEWEKKQDVDDQGNPKVDENGEPVMINDKDKPTKGQAMMGYVVSKEVIEIVDDKEVKKIKVLECGTNLLAALFPNHGLGDNPFQPTTTAIDGEEIMSFHPSDLDMPIEEDTFEPEEYQPLPVYPIVEPTIE